MKVKDLIKHLSEYNQELTVSVRAEDPTNNTGDIMYEVQRVQPFKAQGSDTAHHSTQAPDIIIIKDGLRIKKPSHTLKSK